MDHQPTAFDEHSAWLRARQSEYNVRKSRASYSSEHDGRWSAASAHSEGDGAVDESVVLNEQMGWGERAGWPSGGVELPEMLERSLFFDDEYDEGPVYRSLGPVFRSMGGDHGSAQPSGAEPEFDFAPPPAPSAFGGAPAFAAPTAMDTVDVAWLAGSNPPLIRRQNAFARA